MDTPALIAKIKQTTYREIRGSEELTSEECRELKQDNFQLVSMLLFSQDFIESHGLREEYEELKGKVNFDE